MTEAEVVRLTQEVNEAESVLAQLLQVMNAEKAKFKEEELNSDVTSDRYNAILTAHMQQWQSLKMEYDEAHRIVAGKKRDSELSAQLLAAEQSTRAKQAKAEATEEQLRAAHQEREEAMLEEQKLREQQSLCYPGELPQQGRYPSEKYQQRGFEQRGNGAQQGGVGQQQSGLPYHATSKAEYHRLRRAGMVGPQNAGFPQQGQGRYPQQGGFPPYQGVPYQGVPYQGVPYQGGPMGGPFQGAYPRGPQQGGFPQQQGMGRYSQQHYGYGGGVEGGFQDGRPGGYQRYSEGGFGTSMEHGPPGPQRGGRGPQRGGYGDRPSRGNVHPPSR